MKILLIQPKPYKDKPLYVFEPLNLGYLASFLRQKGYLDVRIRCGAFDTDEDIVAEASKADLVGITATSPMMTHGRKLAKGIKERNKNAVVTFGGPHSSVTAESNL